MRLLGPPKWPNAGQHAHNKKQAFKKVSFKTAPAAFTSKNAVFNLGRKQVRPADSVKVSRVLSYSHISAPIFALGQNRALEIFLKKIRFRKVLRVFRKRSSELVQRHLRKTSSKLVQRRLRKTCREASQKSFGSVSRMAWETAGQKLKNPGRIQKESPLNF